MIIRRVTELRAPWCPLSQQHRTRLVLSSCSCAFTIRTACTQDKLDQRVMTQYEHGAKLARNTNQVKQQTHLVEDYSLVHENNHSRFLGFERCSSGSHSQLVGLVPPFQVTPGESLHDPVTHLSPSFRSMSSLNLCAPPPVALMTLVSVLTRWSLMKSKHVSM